MLIYLWPFGDILWPFGTFCFHLVHFYGFGVMYQEKSGNPGRQGWLINGPKCSPIPFCQS
jgi:hypothetical protein